jgi:hypothetical protein
MERRRRVLKTRAKASSSVQNQAGGNQQHDDTSDSVCLAIRYHAVQPIHHVITQKGNHRLDVGGQMGEELLVAGVILLEVVEQVPGEGKQQEQEGDQAQDRIKGDGRGHYVAVVLVEAAARLADGGQPAVEIGNVIDPVEKRLDILPQAFQRLFPLGFVCARRFLNNHLSGAPGKGNCLRSLFSRYLW